jgi:hypothetical protein
VIPDVVPGQHLSILVIGDPTTVAGDDVTITVDGLSAKAEVQVPPTPAPGQDLVASLSFTPPTGTQYASQFPAHYKATTSAKALDKSNDLTFNVGSSGYHFSAGILLPIVFNGSRTVTSVRLPNTTQSTLQVQQGMQAVPVALAFEYFPWGIQGGPSQASSFTTPDPDSCTKSSRAYAPVECPFAWFYKRVIQTIGVEAATTIGANPFQEYFIGGSIEPVRGASLNVGAAFVQGQFLPPNYTSGVLAPTANAPYSVYTQYMVQPYIGLTLSPEVLAFVVDALKTAQTLAPVAP